MKCKVCGTDHRGVARHGGYCLDHQERRAEVAEARAAQLEIDNDEMQGYINEIRVALHTEKDELTIGAVQRIISERDEARRQLAEAQATAKSNGEMWAQCDQQLKLVTADYIEAANTIRELRERVKELEECNDELSGFDMSYGALVLKNQNVGIRHTEYEGESETPFGQQLDGMGDEVEP